VCGLWDEAFAEDLVTEEISVEERKGELDKLLGTTIQQVNQYHFDFIGRLSDVMREKDRERNRAIKEKEKYSLIKQKDEECDALIKHKEKELNENGRKCE
jgi:hypothetical protein